MEEILFEIFLGTECLALQPLTMSAVTTVLVNETCPSAAMLDATHQDIQKRVESLFASLRICPPCARGGPGEWTRIAHLNMSDPSQQYPPDSSLITTPVRGCGRYSRGCDSANFHQMVNPTHTCVAEY